MTREEYLKELKNNILALSTEEQNEALQYYSDYFEEANDDEKVINELGSPEELSKTIIEKFANALVDSKSSSDKEKREETVNGYNDALYYEFKKSSVSRLNIRVGAADVAMIKGKNFSVETRGITEDAMNCYLSNDGTLYINNSKRFNLNFWNHDRRTRWIPKILITVPEGVDLEKIQISVGAGNFRAKDVDFGFTTGSIDVGAGNLVLNALKGGRLNMRCGMGNIDYTGAITGSSNIDCGMGNISIRLKGNPSDYSYDAKVGLGDFKFNNEKKSGVCQIYNNERKENHFSVNCGMGSVSVKFE